MLLQDPPENPVVTMCGHVFCYQCVSEYLTGDDNTCPAPECKEQLGSEVVFSKATLSSCLSDDVNGSPVSSQLTESSIVMQNEYSSSKIRAVLQILRTHCNMHSSIECNGSSPYSENPCAENCHSGVSATEHSTSQSKPPVEGPIKAIVFSQWTSMLDLVENSLNLACVEYRRLDGTMTLGARDRAVRDFNTDPEVWPLPCGILLVCFSSNISSSSSFFFFFFWFPTRWIFILVIKLSICHNGLANKMLLKDRRLLQYHHVRCSLL
jgi:hypothetical protein